MSHRYSIADARTNLPSLVDRAEAGIRVELTRRGKPVAFLISLREFERSRSERARFADVYRTFLESHSLEKLGFESDFFASLRDKSLGRKVSV